MKSILITGANIVNEGKITLADIFVKDGMIYNLGPDLSNFEADIHIDATGKICFSGTD
jgi:dihydroorotase